MDELEDDEAELDEELDLEELPESEEVEAACFDSEEESLAGLSEAVRPLDWERESFR